MPKKVLVLDLDETLICSRMQPDVQSEMAPSLRVKSEGQTLILAKRPGLESFLKEMSKHFTLILYTAGSKRYANLVLKALAIEKYFSLVLHRDYCPVNAEGKKEKFISILAADPKDIILVDDSSVHVKNQPDNILLIEPFEGEKYDCELYRISDFLVELSKKKDVRPVMDSYKKFKQRTIGRKGRVLKWVKTLEFVASSIEETPDTVIDDGDSELGVEDENSDGSSLAERLEKINTQFMPRKLLRDSGLERVAEKTQESIGSKKTDDIIGKCVEADEICFDGLKVECYDLEVDSGIDSLNDYASDKLPETMISRPKMEAL